MTCQALHHWAFGSVLLTAKSSKYQTKQASIWPLTAKNTADSFYCGSLSLIVLLFERKKKAMVHISTGIQTKAAPECPCDHLAIDGLTNLQRAAFMLCISCFEVLISNMFTYTDLLNPPVDFQKKEYRLNFGVAFKIQVQYSLLLSREKHLYLLLNVWPSPTWTQLKATKGGKV